MSQRTVEVVLGRLVTDESFRSAFFEDPDDVCSDANLDLTHDELSALLRVDEDLVAALGASMRSQGSFASTAPAEAPSSAAVTQSVYAPSARPTSKAS